MNHTLVRNGHEIPSIGLGTWDMQGSVCSNIVHEALDIGYRHIDCASMYENEKRVGKGLFNSGVDRKEIFITTKINTDWMDSLYGEWPISSK
jgi:2,5-diketo-D-gluconate reductase B